MKPCIIVAVLVISACGDTGGLETESTTLLSPVVEPSQPVTEQSFTPIVRLVAPAARCGSTNGTVVLASTTIPIWNA